MDRDALDDLAEWAAWEGASATRAMVRMNASQAPAVQVLTWVRSVGTSRAAIDVGPELDAAAQALLAAPPGAPLGADGTARAADAVRALADRLEQVSDGRDAAVRSLLDEIRGTTVSPRDVAQAMRAFAGDLLARDPGATPTFSLILVRSSDHDGAVQQSLRTRIGTWRGALEPADGGPDHHAAILLPPTVERLVDRVARQLGLDATDLPGVAFLGPVEGGMPADFESRLQPSVWTQWAFVPFGPVDSAGPYPDQLRQIYRGVYGQGALFPGRQGAVVADRVVKWLRAHVSPWGLAKLLLTSKLGPGGGEVLTLVEQVGKPAEDA